MFPQAHETRIDGVPAFWTEIEESPQVTLTFGVGTRDEPAHLSGVTHLMEHLLFSSMEPTALITNGSTGPSVLTLTASGTSDDLVRFVHEVTAAIRTVDRVPDSEVLREKGVLEAETTYRYAQPACSLLAYRFGYSGIGKASAGTVALHALTIGDVAHWARTYLTRDNLVLTFVGRPPEDITVDLPNGTTPARPVETDEVLAPTVVPSERHHLAFSLVTTPSMASHLACVLDHEILADLRNVRGLIYSTDTYITDVDDKRTALDVHLDPLADRTIPALEHLLALLHRVRDDGVSAEAVEYSLRCLRDAAADRSATGHDLLNALASGHVLGTPALTRQTAVAEADSVTPASMSEVVRAALKGLLIAVDDDQVVPETLIDSRGLTLRSFDLWTDSGAEQPGDDAVRWRARRRGDLPGYRLTLDETHVRMNKRGVDQLVRLKSLAFVSHRDDGWIGLLDDRGRSGAIDMTDFRGGHTILAELRSRIPDHVVRAMPPT